MIFTTKQLNQYETVAEILAAARQEKGWDLEKIEKATKISKKYLLALEAGRYDALPSAIYTKNFARVYAEYLGQNVKKISQLIDRELEIMDQVKTKPPLLRDDYEASKIVFTPRTFRLIGAAVVGLACFIYLGWQISAIFFPPPLTITSPEPNLVTTENLIIIAGQTLPEVQVTINNQEVLTDQQGNFTKSLDLQTGLNTITIQAKKKHSRAATVERQILVEPLEVVNANPAPGATEVILPEPTAPATPTNQPQS
ncbi:MAG: helix-turn-helix domain-containing protein [Patescibacteria group bacterium]|jgi:cytoskeletal protein RodZ